MSWLKSTLCMRIWLRTGRFDTTVAAFRPDLAAQLRDHYSPAQDSVQILLDTAARRGQLVEGVRPDLAATTLRALIDGLTVQLLIGLLDLGTAKRVLYRTIDALFTNPAAR